MLENLKKIYIKVLMRAFKLCLLNVYFIAVLLAGNKNWVWMDIKLGVFAINSTCIRELVCNKKIIAVRLSAMLNMLKKLVFSIFISRLFILYFHFISALSEVQNIDIYQGFSLLSLFSRPIFCSLRHCLCRHTFSAFSV